MYRVSIKDQSFPPLFPLSEVVWRFHSLLLNSAVSTMRKMYLLLLLVAMLHGVSAIDTYLKRLCLSPYIDSPLDKDGKSRIQGDTCVQTFPYEGTQEQHETFCRSALPFEAETKSSGHEVTCTWKLSSECRRDGKVKENNLEVRQIHGKCYVLTRHVPCHDLHFVLARPTSVSEIRWIAALYSQHSVEAESNMAVKIDPGRALKILDDIRIKDGLIYKATDKKYRDVTMILSRMSIFGLYPGDLVPQEDNLKPTEKAYPLCTYRAIVSGGATNSYVAALTAPASASPSANTDSRKEQQSFGSGSAYSRVPLMEGGSIVGYAFITRNDYQPILTTEGLVDLSHFHSQCAKICDDCFAATYETFTKHRQTMPYGRFYVTGTRLDKESSCGGDFDMSNRKRFKIKNLAKTSSSHIPKAAQWWAGSSDTRKQPSYACADQERVAVQLIHTSDYITYVDVPVFDRQPIVCISGPTVSDDDGDEACFANSVMSGGGCVCKPEFKDARDIPDLVGRATELGFHKAGQICVKTADCRNVTEFKIAYTGVIFLVDGSMSISYYSYLKAKDFVRSFTSLPNMVPILFYQYARKSQGRFAFLDKGWNDHQYTQKMQEALGNQFNGLTYTYKHMENAIDLTSKWEAGRKLLIVLTDGDPNDTIESRLQAKRKDNRIETTYITIGSGTAQKIKNKELDNDYKVHSANDYGDLNIELMESLVKSLCDPYPEGHIEKIIYGPEWKSYV